MKPAITWALVAAYLAIGVISYGHEIQRDACPSLNYKGECTREAAQLVGLFAFVFWPWHLSSVLWKEEPKE